MCGPFCRLTEKLIVQYIYIPRMEIRYCTFGPGSDLYVTEYYASFTLAPYSFSL